MSGNEFVVGPGEFTGGLAWFMRKYEVCPDGKRKKESAPSCKGARPVLRRRMPGLVRLERYALGPGGRVVHLGDERRRLVRQTRLLVVVVRRGFHACASLAVS